MTAVSEGFDGHEPTGNTTVDKVIESLDQLEGAPVSDHVAVFEQAHERLRGALADVVTDQQPS